MSLQGNPWGREEGIRAYREKGINKGGGEIFRVYHKRGMNEGGEVLKLIEKGRVQSVRERI